MFGEYGQADFFLLRLPDNRERLDFPGRSQEANSHAQAEWGELETAALRVTADYMALSAAAGHVPGTPEPERVAL